VQALYAVMRGKKVVNSNYQEKAIIISYNPLSNKFEVGYQATKNDKEWIYNISEIYTTSSYQFINKYITALSEYRTSKGLELIDAERNKIAENINIVYNLKIHTLPQRGTHTNYFQSYEFFYLRKFLKRLDLYNTICYKIKN
jgi:hypothetical protein